MLKINNILYQYDARNFVKDTTCFKSIESASCFDLIITNYQNITVISTGLSDFHIMALIVLKTKV